ncbi:MAG: hypothetical protein ACYTFI_07375, partial [Planctomycetota bacterium]
MIDLENSPRLRKQWLLVRAVYVMVLITSAIYLVVCLLLAYVVSDGEFKGFIVQGDDAFFAMLRIVLMVMSFPMAGLGFWVRGLMKRGRVPAGLSVFLYPVPRVPSTPEDAALARLVQAMLVSMAFAEAPGIFGLVTFLLMGSLAWLVVFLVISFAAKLFL